MCKDDESNDVICIEKDTIHAVSFDENKPEQSNKSESK